VIPLPEARVGSGVCKWPWFENPQPGLSDRTPPALSGGACETTRGRKNPEKRVRNKRRQPSGMPTRSLRRSGMERWADQFVDYSFERSPIYTLDYGLGKIEKPGFESDEN